jgi:peptide/nickel transport system substrate-binding protein
MNTRPTETVRVRIPIVAALAGCVTAGGAGLAGHEWRSLPLARAPAAPSQPAPAAVEERLIVRHVTGRPGGQLVVAARAEPRTLNPVMAVDNPSRDVIRLLGADLIHINRRTHLTEPALARSWQLSPDQRTYTIRLRRGLRFSDGQPFDADDVVFTFQVYLDEAVHSPQRPLLVVGGKPIQVRKLDQFAVEVTMAEPYAAAERVFDSIAILPRHRLEQTYREGKVGQAWSVTTPPDQVVGLGPFRLKSYVPGQRLDLEPNPHYWKSDAADARLPYLAGLTFLFVPSEDAQALRFQAGETHVIARPSAENFAALAAAPQSDRYRLADLGPGLEYNFLFFNLNDLASKGLTEPARKQAWFRLQAFRQAVSAAIDRQALVRLVFKGRAAPLWGHVTPGNRLWVNDALPRPPRSVDRARALLGGAGFSWTKEGTLVDAKGAAVEFSILAATSAAARVQMATMIQADLADVGIRAHVVPMEFRALVDRVTGSFDYEACVLGIGSGDVDPTAEMNVWPSGGATHLWHLGQPQPATAWEAEIDRLMARQLTTLDPRARKALYDRVQQIVATELPIIPLASPNILVGARRSLGNFQPGILDPYTLWNVEELYWREPPGSR